MIETKKYRFSNLELYRIVVMFLIICHHYVVNSGLIDVMESHAIRFGGEGGYDADIRQVFYFIFGAWGKVGINCFVLITGYFMCKSSITIRKFLKLVLQVLFYQVAIWGIFLLFDKETSSVSRGINVLLPVSSITDGFTSCFLIFYLTIPFLNILVNNMSKLQHGMLIGLSLFVYSFWEMLGFEVGWNYVIWFSVLYFIASYIRFYGLWKSNNAMFWGRQTLLMLTVSIASIVLPFLLRGWCTWFFVSDSNHIMAVLLSVSSFMWFKNMKIEYKNTINTIASTTFGILLIHTNSSTMRGWLWNDICQCTTVYYSEYFWIIALLSCIVIFVICSLIDWIRISTVERWVLNLIDKKK